MTLTDPIGDMYSRIRNGQMRSLNSIEIPSSNFRKNILQILKNEGYIKDYFIEKKLFPNVDFYSGIILKALGFPTSMFTVLFAIGRTVGWISQWKEMIEDPINKIGRPRQLYLGKNAREFQKESTREKKSIFKWLWK